MTFSLRGLLVSVEFPSVKITNDSPQAFKTKIVFDGRDISPWVHRYQIGASCKDMTTLTLELYAGCVEVDGVVLKNSVSVTPELEAVLVAYGWTPPPPAG